MICRRRWRGCSFEWRWYLVWVGLISKEFVLISLLSFVWSLLLIMSYFLGNRDRAMCRHACTVSILLLITIFFALGRCWRWKLTYLSLGAGGYRPFLYYPTYVWSPFEKTERIVSAHFWTRGNCILRKGDKVRVLRYLTTSWLPKPFFWGGGKSPVLAIFLNPWEEVAVASAPVELEGVSFWWKMTRCAAMYKKFDTNDSYEWDSYWAIPFDFI